MVFVLPGILMIPCPLLIRNIGAAVILFNTGFWSVEVKLGPLHAYVTVPLLELGVTLKVTFSPSQIGLAGLEVMSLSATAGSSTVTVTVLVAVQL